MNNSQFSGSLSWQSASLPGSELISNAEFFLETSRAFLAASLAAAASKILEIISFESLRKFLLQYLDAFQTSQTIFH